MMDALSTLAGLEPTLVWGVFPRLVGLLFLISFTSLSGQVIRGAGRNGGMPIGRRLDKIREDFPSWRRVLYFPTLLWLSHRDGMLRLLIAAGLAGAALAIYGGPFSFWGLLICYVCYLSLDMAMGLIFPWDCGLFELGFLSLFLPATLPLPEMAATAAPAPALCWAFRLLVFRVLFGFGKLKFIGASLDDFAYLKGFLVAQPLPSPLGWYAQKLPLWMLKGLMVFMFIVEIPVPFFVFFPGELSVVAAILICALMIGIQAMGNFGYFSLLTIVACVPLFDNVTPTQLSLTGLFSEGAPIFTNVVVLLHTLGLIFVFPLNSWIAQSWHNWSFWLRLPRWLQLPIDFYRWMHPFRWLHSYGVFPPKSFPGVKVSLLVEATWDKSEWKECAFRLSPSNPWSPPKFIAPHHPRGDQAVIYETFGLNPTSLISSMLGPWDPYSYGTQPAANVLLQRIVEGHGLDFLDAQALREHDTPPVAARITTAMLEPASLTEHRRTGKWWERSYVGPHTPPRELDPRFWDEFLPEPEMWHFDAIIWRRRSKLKKLMDRALAGDDPKSCALAEATDLGPEDVDTFWNDFIPLVGTEDPESFDNLPDTVDRVRARFSREEIRKLYRLLGRTSLVLIAKLEPLYLGRGFKPLIAVKTYFHLWMLVQQIISEGREAYEAAVRDPESVAERAEEVTVTRGLYLLSVFRFEAMCFEAQKLRLIEAFMPPYDKSGEKEVSYDDLNAFEKLVARMAESFSGFFEVMPVLKRHFKGPRFDQGYPERYPSFALLPSGEVKLRERAISPETTEAPLAGE